MKFRLAMIFGLLALSSSVAQQRTATSAATSLWTNSSPEVRTMGPGTVSTDGAEVVELEAVPEESVAFRTLEDGRYVFTFRVTVPTAHGARLHFERFHLPEHARVTAYVLDERGAATTTVGPYEKNGPTGSGEFWSEVLPGSSVVVQLEGEGDAPAVLPFVVDQAELSTNAAMTPAPATEFAAGEQIVVEGDILLTPEQQRALASQKGRSAVIVPWQGNKWPNGVMPYILDPALANPQRTLDAINHWNTLLAGVIRIVPRSSEKDYVRFKPASSSGNCSSFIGRTGGEQPVSLGGSCSTGNVIHEIGHALGLVHEQSREDRDTHVQVSLENTASDGNFSVTPWWSDDVVYYDYGSIMHYPDYGFSNNGKPVITTKPAGIPIGQRSALSAGDIIAICQLYGGKLSATPSGTVPVIVTSVPLGSYVTVDGTRVRTPATYFWAPGSKHTVAADASISTSANSQTVFVRWTDGGAASHTVTTPTVATALAAFYRVVHPMRTATTGAGTMDVDSSSPAVDAAMYPANANVTLTARPAPGFCLASWSGISSSALTARFTLTSPKTVTANFQPGTVVVPAAQSAPAGGATLPQAATVTPGCTWAVASQVPWLRVSRGTISTGTPTFNITVDRNTTATARSGQVMVGDQLVTVTQAAQ